MNKIPNRQAICETLMEHAKTDKDIIVLCSDSRGSASLTPFFTAFPEQSVEVGIAEQNLVSISAGLASCGKKPWCASPASFVSTRSYEQCKVEATELAYKANPNDRAYFVPAFTGLGAPYWDSRATGLLTGVTRTTGRAEIAKACLDCVAYQITDLVELMRKDSGLSVDTIRVDGGPTASQYLMQFQSDIADAAIQVPDLQELSGMGAAYMAGIAIKIYDETSIYQHIQRREFVPHISCQQRDELYVGWKEAIARTLYNNSPC